MCSLAGRATVGLAVGTFAGLATVVLAVRLLEPAAYGALAFGLSTAVVFAGVGRLGLEAAVARAIAIDPAGNPPRQEHDVAHGALSLVALTGIAGSLATFTVIEVWARGVDNPARTVLAASLGLVLYGSNVAAVAAALARGRGRVVSMELPNLVATLGRFAAVGLLAILGVASRVGGARVRNRCDRLHGGVLSVTVRSAPPRGSSRRGRRGRRTPRAVAVRRHGLR